MRKIISSLGLVALLAIPSACGRDEAPVEAPKPEVTAPAPKPTETRVTYSVRNGDYLSRIVYNELGLRGHAIYDSLPAIQARSGFGPERDVYMVDENGQLVEGKDGFVDLIYPGEKVVLK